MRMCMYNLFSYRTYSAKVFRSFQIIDVDIQQVDVFVDLPTA